MNLLMMDVDGCPYRWMSCVDGCLGDGCLLTLWGGGGGPFTLLCEFIHINRCGLMHMSPQEWEFSGCCRL